MQAGELTENLKRTQGRSHHLNRTLKSVLSESSVADPSLGGTRMAANQDGPKSAENVNEQELVSTDENGRVSSSKIFAFGTSDRSVEP